MSEQTREYQLAQTFVTLADTLVAEYDIVDVLQTLVEQASRILAASDAGILLPNDAGDLEVVASTSERSHLISLLQLRADEGPCVDAFNTGKTYAVDDIAATGSRWPTFESSATAVGYRSMYAIPMRFREETIGSLNVFSDRLGPLPSPDMVIATALTDIATVTLIQERALREANIARSQLQRALESRIVIEQAKGVIAHREQVDMDEAFALLRSEARASRRRLSLVAQEVIDAAIGIDGTDRQRRG
jgi:hypothetical protein